MVLGIDDLPDEVDLFINGFMISPDHDLGQKSQGYEWYTYEHKQDGNKEKWPVGNGFQDDQS